MVREDRQEELAHVDIWEGIPVLENLVLLCCHKAQQERIFPYLLLQLIVPTYSRTL